MAEGAATLTKRWLSKPEWGALKTAYLTLTLGADGYNTTGYECDLTYYGGLDSVHFVGLPNAVIGYVPEYDATAKKLKFYYQDANASLGAHDRLVELTDGSTALNSQVVYIKVEGHGV